MNAIEIMDPRMDSGAVLPPSSLPNEVEKHLSFDPLAPLLPEEVTWIIDRSMAGEMGWHGGSTLSQTVYTLLYVHQLARIAPDRMLPHGDSTRPLELVYLVLRPAVIGLLKTCDLVWRELIKGHVYDGEDFHSDKFDVSLCENFQVGKVIELLDSGIRWLSTLSDLPWSSPLIHRLELRKCILLTISQPSDVYGTQEALIHDAQRLLHLVVSSPPFPPSVDSPARSAFDPTISRRLVSIAPLKTIELINQENAWKALGGMLEGLLEAYKLRDCDSPLKFMSALETRSRAPGSSTPMRNAFVRSLTSSVISHKHPRWILDVVYSGITLVPYDYLSSLARTAGHFLLHSGYLMQQPGMISDSLEEIENRIKELLVFLASAFNQNRSRTRRTFSKMLFAWHKLDEDIQGLVGLMQQPTSTSQIAVRITSRLPLAIHHIRLSIIIEHTFSGFELDLYTLSEYPFTYWYVSTILTAQIRVITALLQLAGSSEMEENSVAYLESKRTLFTALRCLSLTRLSMLARKAKSEDLRPVLDSDRQRMNMQKRFDWILPGEGESTNLPDVGKPNWTAYEIDMVRLKRREDGEAIAKDIATLRQARSLLLELKEAITDDSTELCPELEKQFIAQLLETSNGYLMILQREQNLGVAKSPNDDIDTHEEPVPTTSIFNTHTWFPHVE